MESAERTTHKHSGAYVGVFVSLVVLTIVTVAVSTFDFGGSTNVVIALAIAAVKGSLVAAIFMHLKWESSRQLWWLILCCAIFAFTLLLLPLFSVMDPPFQAQMGTWGD